MYDKVKKFYDMGLYNETRVYEFVKKGKLTEEEYKEIVGANGDG